MGNRSESETLDLKIFGWSESFPCHFNENTERVVSFYFFQMKLVPLEMYYGARAQGRMGWYAFECKARQAAQVTRNSVFCVISHELRKAVLDMEMKQRKTAERGFVCAETEITPLQNTHAHKNTHTHTFAHFKTLLK